MNDTEAALAALATVGEALMAAAAHQLAIIRVYGDLVEPANHEHREQLLRQAFRP